MEAIDGGKEIQVYTRNKSNVSDTPSNFRLALGTQDLVKKVALTRASIPPLWNVTQYNNIIIFNEGGSDLTVTITPGYYTESTLATAIAAAMTAAGGTYTCTYSAVTYKFTIAETAGPTAFVLKWSSNKKTQKLGSMLGFGISDTASTTSQTGSQGGSLRINNLFFVDRELGVYNRADTTSRGFTFRLPLTGANNEWNQLFFDKELEKNTVVFSYDRAQYLSHLDVQIVDEWGDSAEFQFDWSFTLLIKKSD